MLQNYVKIALRHFRQNRAYLLINILGLGLALAFCLLSYTNYQYAHSFDQWHPDQARMYRVEAYRQSNHQPHGTSPATLAQVAPGQIAGVEAATRIDSRGLTVKRDEHVFAQQVHFVDENFLDLFEFPLLAGQARLADRNALLITEEMAQKYFGTENPIGQAITLYADEPAPKAMTVSGVLKNCPKNSSLRFDFLTHLDNQLQGDKPVVYDSWRWFVDATFLRLKPGTGVAAVESALQAYDAPQTQANATWQVERYRLGALAQMALESRSLRWNNLWSGVPPAAVWGNITVALMLLLTACLNFANTTIAIGNRRLREMGVRKVMGGTSGQLMRQLLAEAFLICLAAVLLGIFLVYPITDWYSATWKQLDLKIAFANNPAILIFLLVTLFGTTLLAGAYPAFYISRFNPTSIFRGSLRFGGASLFSRLMLGMQIAISVAALVVGFGFAHNASVQRHADVGYNRESLLGVELPDMQSFRAFQDVIRQNPKIEASAGTRHHIGFSFRQVEFEHQGVTQETRWLEAGKEYLPLVEMEMKAGEGFSRSSESGTSPDILVNETFVREVGGGQDMLGQTLQLDSGMYRIVGVVHDFMIDSPFDPMTPVVVHLVPEEQYRFCIVKTKPEDLHAVFGDLERSWKQLFPYKPFNGFYQNQVVAEAIEVSDNIAGSMLVFSIVILLLTISGLFAIVSLNALKQFRALAIRRVLGATSGHISFQLNRNYLLVLLISLLAGAWMGRFFALAMMNSIYKIHAGIPLSVLFFSSTCLIVVILATLGIKVWQIWRMKLTEALKAE
ncbi:MAG: ABC transporter permease [Saprospiraceae bacterium]|nr:ABC transporter permease [Saprospiraceae bacterium]